MGEMDETIANINVIRPFNQRIDLNMNDENNIYSISNNSVLDGNVINGILGNGANVSLPGGDDNGPDLDDDELTRDKVKRASTQILLAMDKKKKKQNKRKPGNLPDNNGNGGGGGHLKENNKDTVGLDDGNRTPKNKD
jgi:hypothetical protein